MPDPEVGCVLGCEAAMTCAVIVQGQKGNYG